jgi:hypothetical protein
VFLADIAACFYLHFNSVDPVFRVSEAPQSPTHGATRLEYGWIWLDLWLLNLTPKPLTIDPEIFKLRSEGACPQCIEEHCERL